MDDMVASIREQGLISPIAVRPIDNGKYQILSGHNRVEAAKILKLTEVPAVVLQGISDDDAALIVTESNLIQRSFKDLDYSERAFILKNHLEAIKKHGGQGKRNDLSELLDIDEKSHVATRLTSGHKAGQEYSLSKDTVARYIIYLRTLTCLQSYQRIWIR